MALFATLFEAIRFSIPQEFIAVNSNRLIARELRAVGFKFGDTPFGSVMRELRGMQDRTELAAQLSSSEQITLGAHELSSRRNPKSNFSYIVETDVEDTITGEQFTTFKTVNSDDPLSFDEIREIVEGFFEGEENIYPIEQNLLDVRLHRALIRKGAADDFRVSDLVGTVQ